MVPIDINPIIVSIDGCAGDLIFPCKSPFNCAFVKEVTVPLLAVILFVSAIPFNIPNVLASALYIKSVPSALVNVTTASVTEGVIPVTVPSNAVCKAMAVALISAPPVKSISVPSKIIL